MDVDAFLRRLRKDPRYAGQIVHVHESPPRPARYAAPGDMNDPHTQQLLSRIGFDRLYSHQAEAIGHASRGKDVLVATGTASGKSLCYALPILGMLHAATEPSRPGTALLLFPTKALCQDQFGSFASLLDSAGMAEVMAGVFDGDTPSALRRKLRDRAHVIFSNPDMVHASLLAQHGRWADFLSALRIVVIDEMHVYSGIFGSNMTHLLKRLFRVCKHYGSSPQVIMCSATIGNPRELGQQLTGRQLEVVDNDGSARGRKVYVLWNPPTIRDRTWRSRRSANVEAHQIMAALIEQGIPTITFSKAKVTAEMIHRYVTDALRKSSPGMAGKVTPYRGGYLPEQRRKIEKDLFSGKLMGVSTTPALELGIDVGCLQACIMVGYPGTRASFFQQSGRAGRGSEDSIVFLVGLDTSVNQYVMTRPDYLFDACVEQAVIDPQNPFVVTGHLRCAAHELPLDDSDIIGFGPYAHMVLRVLQDNHKVKCIDDRWYYAASEQPQQEITLRGYADENVVIEDVGTGKAIGQVNKFDAQPILHPQAIYLHQGDSYLVESLDLQKNVARVRRVDVDYYTQPQGGTDIHHIDNRLREKPFGTGMAYWGEVTAYFSNFLFEKIRLYELDPISVHDLDLPTMVLETLAFWLVPPEDLMVQVSEAGLDGHAGLRGIGYATRMLLPFFMTCDTRDFSHTVGSANSPWNAVFVYERYPHGLGFTGKAFDTLDRVIPAVLENVKGCGCDDGCPRCVGKPLRGYTTWNVERGEASIPSKAATLMVLEGLVGDGANLKTTDSAVSSAADTVRLEAMLRRRLERMREPQVFHPITPEKNMQTVTPGIESPAELDTPDVSRRAGRRRSFERELRRKLAKKLDPGGLSPMAPGAKVPPGTRKPGGVVRPDAFKPKPDSSVSPPDSHPPAPPDKPALHLGDTLAARARRLKKRPPPDSSSEV